MVLPASSYALPQGSLVLVTGASSYIASHIIDILLELGYNARGTVRSEKPWLNQYYDKKYGSGKFTTVLVPKMQDDGAFDDCFEGVSGVIHVAADLSFSPDPDAVIPVTVRGTMNILKAASRSAQVKRVVMTSSSSATIDPKPNTKQTVDEGIWNESAMSDAFNANLPPREKVWAVYAASKTTSELKAWEFITHENPGFVFNSVVTCFNVGSIIIPETKGSVSMGSIRSLLSGETMCLYGVLPQWFVDVRDTGLLHVVGLLDPKVQSQRLFAYTAPYSCTKAIEVLRKLRPQNKSIPDALENEGADLMEVPPSLKAEKYIRDFFGKESWTTIEESLEAGIRDLD